MRMKRLLTTLLTLVPIAAGLVIVQQPRDTRAQTDACNDKRTISVSGAATVVAAPDYAILTFTINKRASTLAAALGALKGDSLKLRDALQRAGVSSLDINTEHFAIAPVYDTSQARDYSSENKAAEQRYYAVNGRVDVTVREIKRLSEFVDLGISNGAEGIDGMQMLDSKLRQHRDEARVLAVKAAKEKAALLASNAGTKIGCVLRIEESSRWWWNGANDLRSQNTVQAAPEAGAGDGQPALSGAINAQADVQMVFALAE
jgi:uncharacterized protein